MAPIPDLQLPDSVDPGQEKLPIYAQVGMGGSGGGLAPPDDRPAVILVQLIQQEQPWLTDLCDEVSFQVGKKLPEARSRLLSPESKVGYFLRDTPWDDFLLPAPASGPPIYRAAGLFAHAAGGLQMMGEQMDGADLLLVLTDVDIEPLPGRSYMLWRTVQNDAARGAVISLRRLDPLVWGEQLPDSERRQTISRRLLAAAINVAGIALRRTRCNDPECFLYAPIDRYRQLDRMTGFCQLHGPANETASLDMAARAQRRQELLEQLDLHRRNLGDLERQRAAYGLAPPLHIQRGLEFEQAEIERIEQELAALN